MVKQPRAIWTWFPVTLLTAVFCCVLWGSASPVIKIAYELFRIGPDDTASRIMLAGARFVIAGCMTIMFGSILARKFLVPKKESWKNVVILSLFQTVGQYYFFFMALAHTSGVRGSIINASGNFIAILFAVFIFRFEKMTLKKLLGCLIGFAGIVLIMGGFRALLAGGSVTLAGEGAMLAADFFYAGSGCLIKIFSKDENPVTLSGYQFLIGGIELLGIGVIMGGNLTFYGIYGIYLCRGLHALGRASQVQSGEQGLDPRIHQPCDGRAAFGSVPGGGQGGLFSDGALCAAAGQCRNHYSEFVSGKTGWREAAGRSEVLTCCAPGEKLRIFAGKTGK